jgi:hypothetical protein
MEVVLHITKKEYAVPSCAAKKKSKQKEAIPALLDE